VATEENETIRRHSRDDVATAALQILDDYGLGDLTMRRIAAALGVQASALYWHFPNKQTLLADLADRIVGRAAPVGPQPDWRRTVAEECGALRDALLAYRDAAEVVASTLALGIGSTAAVERLAAAIASGGFDEETSQAAAPVLLHFVLGHVQHEQQRMQYDSLGIVPEGRSVLDGQSPSDRFFFGVELFTGGLELKLRQR
jgi:AcrR family transcriptional regulator